MTRAFATAFLQQRNKHEKMTRAFATAFLQIKK
jgi:hypothetical protein